MRTFHFQGIDSRGRTQAGRMGAADESELEARLRGQGVWLLDARPEQGRPPARRRNQRVRRRQLIHFSTLMAFQTRVGVPLVQALDAAAEDGDSGAFGRLVLEIKRQVEAGASLADALESFPRAFAPDSVQLLRAGERGGSLPESFTQLKHHLEWQERVAAEVKQATIYPAVVLVTTGVFVLVLFTFVVPKFVALLAAVKVPLPGPTRFVFAISAFVRESGWVVPAGAVLLGGGAAWARRRSASTARALDRGRLSLPVVGSLVRLLVLTRFAHNLAILYRNGVTLPAALELVGGIVGSPVLAEAVHDTRKRVLAGASLSEALRRHPVFPALLVRLVVIGERTGLLDEALEHVAQYYHELLPQRLKRLLSLLEPALILSLVAIVGLVALAVILPVLSLMQNLR